MQRGGGLGVKRDVCGREHTQGVPDWDILKADTDASRFGQKFLISSSLILAERPFFFLSVFSLTKRQQYL